MTLSNDIKKWSSKVHTDAYAMSFGELMNLYENKELDIHPEFQRFFRWSPTQKSRLIESILLGIPLPSIFVSQRKDGVWDVIDGLQRLSTVFQLAGILKNEEGKTEPPLVLEKTKYLPSLEGLQWNTDEEAQQLPAEEKLTIKRAKIDVKIIKKQSDKQTRYELFQRLNTGGSQLSDQEVRNCILISIDSKAYRELRKLASEPDFIECCELTDRAVEEQYDMELVLRFLLLVNIQDTEIKKIVDIGEFLTDTMIERATARSLVTPELSAAFKSTFSALASSLKNDSFRKYSSQKNRFEGGFLISGFEGVGLGLGSLFVNNPDGKIVGTDIISKAKQLWAEKKFVDGIGSGKRASERMPVSIPFGRKHFEA